MDFTGSLRASDGHKDAKPKTRRMSYQFRVGQVGQVLATHSEVTIYDLARLLDMSPRQMHNICDRMAKEGRISVRQAAHHNWFKHLISRP
jgi:hypothetical protein